MGLTMGAWGKRLSVQRTELRFLFVFVVGLRRFRSDFVVVFASLQKGARQLYSYDNIGGNSQ